MALFVFPDPRAAVKALLEGEKAARWPNATIQTKFPSAPLAGTQRWIPHAWDGTPTELRNMQRCTIRVTTYAPKGQANAAIDLAQLVRAFLLDSGTAVVWAFRPGPGPAPGTDDATKNEFCTFTLTADTRPSAVA